MTYKLMRQDGYDANHDGLIDKASGVQASFEAGVGGVNAFQVCIVAPDGTTIPADGENATHAGLVMGIAPADIAEGEDGYVQVSGEIANLDWDLDPGEKYFVGPAGTITKMPPAVGFWQKIGVAKDSVTLVIILGEAIEVL